MTAAPVEATGSNGPTGPTDAGDAADERLRRWRLVLGGEEADGTGCVLAGQDAAMDGALTALYGKDGKGRSGRDRSAGLGASAPS
ncbi:hypothetical protein ACFWIZ_24285, partial [Streptomyces sp. NPDC127044]